MGVRDGPVGQGEGGSVGLLPLAGPVQGEGEGNAGPGQGVRGEKREGNRFSNLCLNGFEFGFEKNSPHLEKDFQGEI